MKGCSTRGGLGCLSIIIGSIAGLIIRTFVPAVAALSFGNWLLLVCAIAAVLLPLMAISTYQSRAQRKLHNEAAAATTEARLRLKDIHVQSNGIAIAVERANFYVDVAAREYAQHRYAPFWDAMEAAATSIGQCHTGHGYLAFDIDQYVNALSGRLHDFPSWDHAVTTLPEIQPALDRFAELKNRAESDYQFASMREFRETRQVMIAGFRTLGEALRHLEHAVVTSIADLKRSVDRSIVMRAADPTHLMSVANFSL